MGILYKSGSKYYSAIQWLLLVIAVLIVVIKDKSVVNLGFTKEKIRSNLLIAAIIVAISVGMFLYTDRSECHNKSCVVLFVLYRIAGRNDIQRVYSKLSVRSECG